MSSGELNGSAAKQRGTSARRIFAQRVCRSSVRMSEQLVLRFSIGSRQRSTTNPRALKRCPSTSSSASTLATLSNPPTRSRSTPPHRHRFAHADRPPRELGGGDDPGRDERAELRVLDHRAERALPRAHDDGSRRAPRRAASASTAASGGSPGGHARSRPRRRGRCPRALRVSSRSCATFGFNASLGSVRQSRALTSGCAAMKAWITGTAGSSREATPKTIS